MPAVGVVMIAAGMGMTGVAAAMMIVGGVLNIVGQVTENKDLVTAGSVLGLIGGGISAAGGTAATEGAAAELATPGATETAAAAVTDTGAAGTSTINAATPTEAAIDSGSLGGGTVASQTSTGATVADVGSSAGTAGGSSGVSGADLVGPGVYNPPGTVAGASPTVTGGGSLSDTIGSIVNSKEFWNGAMNVVGGALKGADEKDMNDERIKLYRDELALKQQQADNANAVPALGKRMTTVQGSTPFVGGVAPVYTAPKVTAPATGIMGGK